MIIPDLKTHLTQRQATKNVSRYLGSCVLVLWYFHLKMHQSPCEAWSIFLKYASVKEYPLRQCCFMLPEPAYFNKEEICTAEMTNKYEMTR